MQLALWTTSQRVQVDRLVSYPFVFYSSINKDHTSGTGLYQKVLATVFTDIEYHIINIIFIIVISIIIIIIIIVIINIIIIIYILILTWQVRYLGFSHGICFAGLHCCHGSIGICLRFMHTLLFFSNFIYLLHNLEK